MGLTVTDSALCAGDCSGRAGDVCAGKGSLYKRHAAADVAGLVRTGSLLTIFMPCRPSCRSCSHVSPDVLTWTLSEALCCASRSVRCFHGWWSYLKLALPSVGACCLEWWLYEGLILMAGWFPNADVAVAAMGVGFNTTALTYTISLGVGGMTAHAARSSYLEGFPVQFSSAVTTHNASA